MVSRNHGPASGLSEPYSAMLIRIVPRLINQAGINRLSVGWRIDDRKVEGWNLNLKDIIVMLKTKRTMLSMKKKQPIVYRPRKSQGTEEVMSASSSFGWIGTMQLTMVDHVCNPSSSHLVTTVSKLLNDICRPDLSNVQS